MDSNIPTPVTSPQKTSVTKKKMMIVEDDFFIRDLYVLQAQRGGFEVITAVDGEEALLKAGKEQMDILLVDLMIPKVDGMTVIKTLKANPKYVSVPCLIVTNLEDQTKEQEAKNIGAVGYLLKIKNSPEMVINTAKSFL